MTKPTRTRIAALAGAAFLLLSSVLSTGCGRQSAAAPPPSGSAEPTPEVKTVHPERAVLRRLIEQPGQIDPYEQTPLYAKISGYVARYNVDIGDAVKKGQLLAELSVPEMEEELRQKEAAEELGRAEVELAGRALKTADATVTRSEASLKQAEATVTRTEASVRRWQHESQRVRRLVPTGAVEDSTADMTQEQLKTAEAALAESKAAIEAARAARDESRARRDQAEVDIRVAQSKERVAAADRKRTAALLAYREIRAPFDGVVTRRNVDTGHFLQPTGSGPGGSPPLFVVMRTDKVRVFVEVPEAEAAAVRRGVRASVRVPALQEQEFTGEVARSSMALDPQARTLRAQIDLPNPDGRLRPGLYVAARIDSERAGALTVPSTAVFVQDDQPMVVRVENGKAQRTPVKVGARHGDRLELLKKQKGVARRGEPIVWEDFTGAEELVVERPASWSDGQEVRATPPGPERLAAAGGATR